MPIPVYAFTGFLESGKTKFIQETLEDPRFNAGERTLLLVMEEGEEEYHADTYPHNCVYQEIIDDLDELTPETLTAMVQKYHARRVVAELNGMRLAGEFYEKMPQDWAIAQEVMFADSGTILSYNANMRQLVVDKLTGAEMVVFNRMPLGADIMPYHKLARAVNRRIDIVYDYVDGSTKFDDIEDPLPFDINAPVIEVGDDDYALFYRDITEEPKKYDKKTVRFKAQVAKLKREKVGMFAPGRFVMTCCEADITFMGIPLQVARRREADAPELRHGGGQGLRSVSQPLPGRGANSDGDLRHLRRAAGPGCGDLLIEPGVLAAAGHRVLVNFSLTLRRRRIRGIIEAKKWNSPRKGRCSMSIDRLQQRIRALKNPSMVSLDPVAGRLPPHLLAGAAAQYGGKPPGAGPGV